MVNNNLEVYRRNIVILLKQAFYSGNQIQSVEKFDLSDEHQEWIAKVSAEFDCPICFEPMRFPKKIFACTHDHYICSDCLDDPVIRFCPQCREDFAVHKPLRRLTSERVFAGLLDLV